MTDTQLIAMQRALSAHASTGVLCTATEAADRSLESVRTTNHAFITLAADMKAVAGAEILGLTWEMGEEPAKEPDLLTVWLSLWCQRNSVTGHQLQRLSHVTAMFCPNGD